MTDYSGTCAMCGHMDLRQKNGFTSDKYWCDREGFQPWSGKVCSKFTNAGMSESARIDMIEKARENRL